LSGHQEVVVRQQHNDERPLASAAYIEELRLGAFKSFVDAVIPLTELTLFIGRNASGKSNALDGLVVLSRMAAGDDLRDALDGSRQDAEPVRGGADGCPPFGRDSFELGCRVRAGDEVYDLAVEVQVRPDLKVVRESLTAVRGAEYAGRELVNRELLGTGAARSERMDIEARYFNGKRGLNPSAHFSANRLLISQVSTRVPRSNAALEVVHRAAIIVQSALQEIFVLDPVPHLMRQYVNERDAALRRNAENLSAAAVALRNNAPEDFAQLEEILRAMPERPFAKIGAARSDLGDVILTLEEGAGRRAVRVSARLMSDGMLRFLAFGTALLSAPLLSSEVALPPTEVDGGRPVSGQRALVIEEVENGLHPTMAAQAVDLVKDQAGRRRVRIIVTTHSPALLNALKGEDHQGVIVFDRESSLSRARRLVDLPGYPELMASGGLGIAVSSGALGDAARDRDSLTDEFSSFLATL
jgi:predicted ATPase